MTFFLLFAAKCQLTLHGQIFDNALLHFIQTVVIAIQHLFRVLHVVVILRINTPRQLQHRVQIVQLGRVVRRKNMHMLETFNSLLELLTYGLRPQFLLRPLTQFLSSLLILVVVPKVLLDGLHLLLQEILALLLVDLLGGTTTDIGLDGQLLQVLLQNRQQRFGTFRQRMNLQQSLFLVGRHVIDRAHIIDHSRVA